ncbi:MAG: hypothetical protein RQ966_09415 [Acetobacteraceae bacterium]|nr:hypothetical protein [Acetobacteraceae bacterium]
MTNWGSATSLGLHKRGVWFKKADVPAGSIPTLTSGTTQFYGLRFWKDGSLKYARLLLRDAALSAGATRAYSMAAATGTLPAGSTASTGNAGLVSALAGHDVRVSFTNVQTWDCSSAAGNYAALGSGSFTASLAAHAAQPTRWTLLTAGAVADVWQGWGMATDNTGGAADAHLKLNWYVTRWKNADGSTLAFQIGAVVALDWWSVANKFFLRYDAALADAGTTIVSFPGVKHHYQSQWLLCINDGSLNAGTAPWIGAAQPTLHCSFDRDYAVAAGVVPPLDTAKRPTPATQYAYVPCGVVADPDTLSHNESHRLAIDATGGYNGRGVITRFDADAFMTGTAQAYTVARLNALSGLGVPYHYRSNRTRTRPGETADVANTIIPLIMRPKAASYSDFTAAGLPVAVDAYTGTGSPSSAQDGFGWQAGLATIPGYPTYRNYAEPPGAQGGWGPSIDTSHAVSYCYFVALVSGDEWLLEAQIDLAMNMAHQGIYGYHNNTQPFAITWNSATPSAYWTGLLSQFQPDAIRALGWSQLIQGHACGLVPADHVAYGYLQANMAHNGDYIAANLDNLPADFAAASFYGPESQLGLNSLYSPWMNAFIPCGAYSHYLLNEDARWKRLGDFTATWPIKQASLGRWYAFDIYRTAHRRSRAGWNATTNPEVPVEQQGVLELGANLTASTGVFTIPQGSVWSSTGVCPPPLTNGDQVGFTSETDGGQNGTIPAGAVEGQVAYIVNLQPGSQITGRNPPTVPPKFQLSATPGGPPLIWSTDTPNVNLTYLPQALSTYAVATVGADYLSFPYIPGWDNYVPINVSAIMLARQAGNTACTTAIRDGALAFTAPMDEQSGYYSAFDMATTA